MLTTPMSRSHLTEANGVPLVVADITAGNRVLCLESKGHRYLMAAGPPSPAPNPWLSFHPGTLQESIFQRRF